jgi:hypothetical protein
MSDDNQIPLSDNTPIIPVKYVPYFLALISISVYLGAEFSLPGEWSADRYFMVFAAILSILVGGSTTGLWKHK